MVLLDLFYRVLDHRQSPEAQEIHLQKPQLLQGGHGKLGGDGAVLSPGQGNIVIHCRPADDHACRVHGGMSGKSLQAHGHVDQMLYLRILVIGTAQIRAGL